MFLRESCWKMREGKGLPFLPVAFLVLPRKRDGFPGEMLTAIQEAIFRISSLSQLSPVSRAACLRFSLSKPSGELGVKKIDGRGPRENHPRGMGLGKNVVTLLLLSALFLRKLLIIRGGAGEGNRTLVSGLGSPHSTIEPHPQKTQSQELMMVGLLLLVQTVQTPICLVIVPLVMVEPALLCMGTVIVLA